MWPVVSRRVEYECDRLSYRLNVATPHSVCIPLPCCGSRDITAGQLHTCRPCPINERSHSGEIRLHSHWHVGFILTHPSSHLLPTPAGPVYLGGRGWHSLAVSCCLATSPCHCPPAAGAKEQSMTEGGVLHDRLPAKGS